jgi:hypothetical protein
VTKAFSLLAFLEAAHVCLSYLGAAQTYIGKISIYIGNVRELDSGGYGREGAMEGAIRWCIEQNFKEMGLPIDQIAAVTGLDPELIRAL